MTRETPFQADARPARTVRPLLVLALTALLAACGGGGGDSGPPPRASMIPTAPTPGATLYADARTLHPLAPGALWSYAGTHTPPGLAALAYSDNVTQVARVDGSVDENGDNVFGSGASTQQVQQAADSVRVTAFDYSGAALPALSTELRSPVRVDDQIAVVEQTVANSGYDVDGDGRNDTVDFATYRRVIGNETVATPLYGSITALRVDVVYLTRFVASSTQQVSPIVSFVQSLWYVPGVGVVRQRLSVPSTSGIDETWDEVLSGFSG